MAWSRKVETRWVVWYCGAPVLIRVSDDYYGGSTPHPLWHSYRTVPRTGNGATAHVDRSQFFRSKRSALCMAIAMVKIEMLDWLASGARAVAMNDLLADEWLQLSRKNANTLSHVLNELRSQNAELCG
jgi:hypothetical protein